MKFNGWLRSPGEIHKGLPVVLTIDDTFVSVSAGDGDLGAWSPHSVDLERADGTAFLFRVDGEDWFFEPSEGVRLLFEGLPMLERAKAAAPRNAVVLQAGVTPAAYEGDSAAASSAPQSPPVSAIPPMVWGLMTAALLFVGLLVGVLVGRYRADGRNLLTGLTVFATLMVGFAWGRVLWQKASRRRVTGTFAAPQRGPSLRVELPVGTESGGGAGPHPAEPIPRKEPSPKPALLTLVESKAAATARPGGERGVRTRGDKALLGLLGDEGDRSEPGEVAEPEMIDLRAVPDTPDDLREIKGIGPAIEKVLHDLGYHTYEDIALLSREQILEIQEHLGNFKNRIYSDNWCLSATRLHREKHGVYPVRVSQVQSVR